MKPKQAIVVFVTSIALGAGTGAAAAALTGNEATARQSATGASPTPTALNSKAAKPRKSPSTAPKRKSKASASPKPAKQLSALADLVIKPGSVGPVVGMMSIREGVNTGYLLEAGGPPPPNSGCWAPRLKWKQEFQPALDLRTNGDGDITEIIVKQPGVTTENGLGVGSTYSEIRDRGSSLGNVSEAELNNGVDIDRDGSSVFIHNAANSGYIGFMFAETPENLTADSKAIYVEVSKGAQPALERLGC